jgi:hypothetical protein
MERIPISRSAGGLDVEPPRSVELDERGSSLTPRRRLNGQKTAELHNGLFVEGPLTLQHAAGVIKFRKVAIKPL